MNSELKIVLLDINGEYEEKNLDQEEEDDKKKNIVKLESPVRIMSQFCSQNIFENLTKDTNEFQEILYKFNYPYQENGDFPCQIYIIDDLTMMHNINLTADAYIVFCNLENKFTSKKLEQMINYIKDSCSVDVKTYVIGIYQNQNFKLEEFNIDNMKLFLDSNQFLYDYFECREEDKNKEDNSQDKNNNEDDLRELKDILGSILKSTHELRNNITPKISRRKANSKNEDEGISNGKCLLF